MRTLKTAVVEPPQVLLTPCAVPDNELAVLEHLKNGNIREAASAYTGYVLDVRDAFEICNARFIAISEF